MKPLHVLSIATLFPDATRPNFGLFVERSLRALAAQPGVRLTIVAPVGLPPWPLSLHPRYRARIALPPREQWFGLDVHRPRFSLLPKYGARFNPRAIARAILPIAQALRLKDGLDVIDSQFFYPDGAAAMQVAQALSLPFSAKARGSDIILLGHGRDTAAQVRATGHAATGLLAVSRSLRQEMAQIGMDPAKIQIHYTGLDADRFHPGDRAAARAAIGLGSGPLILSVGALIERKGQGLVIDALPALPGVQYALAGSGEAEAAYRAQAAARGVADRVHFLGPVANAALPQLYRAADIFALMSASEGLANAWVEALACGTPILISDVGGARELVTGPDAGQIADRTPGAIAAAVQLLLASPPPPAAVAATLGDRFDWDRNGRELAEHLRRCAAH